MQKKPFFLLCFVLAGVFFALPLLAGRTAGDFTNTAALKKEVSQSTSETAAAENSSEFSYRAVWISYLEWQSVDFSSADAFLCDIKMIFYNISSLGANVAIVQVRPFGDALYPSEFYPFSHLCTGKQGQSPGFDPLALLVQTAHEYGLELEAWVNPYRIQENGVPALCEESPAVQHPEWVKSTSGGLYLDPSNKAVQQYIADALAELCDKYQIDGIHFDDYFYPTTDVSFDKDEYASSETELSLEDWRQQNVNNLIQLCYTVVHERGRRLGVSPQGDPVQNLELQYSNAALWLTQEGYADYIMPQLYRGISYTKDGDASHNFKNLAEQWANFPRSEKVCLYVGLGAYRIGDGDGGDTSEEWQSGHALAQQRKTAAELGFTGAGLYRYGSLFENENWEALAAAERKSIQNGWLF